MEEVKSENQGTGVEESAAAGGAAGETDPPADQAEIADPAGQLAALAAERDRLAQENADLNDRLLRRQAEFDNFRKRAERERYEMVEYAAMEAVKAILPIADDFERALKSECADKEYARGMEMIEQRLQESLKKLGLEPVEALGKKFDPNLHHAVSKMQSEEHEEEEIVEEYQKGYRFKERLLRPAMVKVAVRP
ncbi:MAG: nucleotide exchange factor GrpE [Bryobacterales bacterium]|nr:nucleotide exchange factor GrpE [Bryobacterales bacterium]